MVIRVIVDEREQLRRQDSLAIHNRLDGLDEGAATHVLDETSVGTGSIGGDQVDTTVVVCKHGDVGRWVTLFEQLDLRDGLLGIVAEVDGEQGWLFYADGLLQIALGGR